jgi:hypothetical protein
VKEELLEATHWAGECVNVLVQSYVVADIRHVKV